MITQPKRKRVMLISWIILKALSLILIFLGVQYGTLGRVGNGMILILILCTWILIVEIGDAFSRWLWEKLGRTD